MPERRERDNSAAATDSAAGHAPDVVLDLRQVGKGDLARAGGKGANLGELIRGGFPVPPGFVVTTAAYDRFVAENDLAGLVPAALRAPAGAAALRASFERGAIPPDIAEAVASAYARLGDGPVAVRSSATAEDLPGAAFAGQQETLLNIVGEPALLDAVRACWASLWTDRAIAYRRRQDIEQETAKLAVVVQRMAPAAAAGVLFTANPLTGARDEIVVDANPGLGEAVVAGLVTPDHSVLAKRSGRVKSARRGRREAIVRALPGGGTETVAGDAASARPALPRSALRELARLGTAIERHFGRPQDIEWTWTGERFFIVQARPMTALPERPAQPGRGPGMNIAGELFPIRPYPFDLTTYTDVALHNVGAAMTGPLGFAPWRVDRMFREEDDVAVGLTPPDFRPTWRTIVTPWLHLWRTRRYDPARWRDDRLLDAAQARVRQLEQRDLGTVSWNGVIATLDEALGVVPMIAELRRRYYLRDALAAGGLWLALAALGKRALWGRLLGGVPSKTTEANRALDALATEIRNEPELASAFETQDAGRLPTLLRASPAGRAFLADLDQFLDIYGHRETAITVASQPTWKDDPTIVLGLLQGLARAPRAKSTGRPDWEIARDQLLASPLGRMPFVRRLFLRLLESARRLFALREDTHFYMTLPMPTIRRSGLELGRRLAEIGVLDTPGEVFHLRLDELKKIDRRWPPPAGERERLRALVRQRADKRASLGNAPLVDPLLLPSVIPSGPALVAGMPGSPGVAEGPVRLIHSAAEFGTLRPGEVLVAPYTNPAWTPLFQRAAAVVVDTGGTASHAAIVAREYGIPAVMGAAGATSRLAAGQRVRVDGDRGLVLPATSAAAGPS